MSEQTGPMERELCRECGGNSVVNIRHGVSVCPRCEGDCWEPPTRQPERDHAALLARLQRIVRCIYIAVEEPTARDIAETCKAAHDAIVALTSPPADDAVKLLQDVAKVARGLMEPTEDVRSVIGPLLSPPAERAQEHPICSWCDKPVLPGSSPFRKTHWPSCVSEPGGAPSPAPAPITEGIERALEPPVFWRHAVAECNNAHAALDRMGAPKTQTVRRIRGEGDQEITIGLAERIQSLVSEFQRLRRVEAAHNSLYAVRAAPITSKDDEFVDRGGDSVERVQGVNAERAFYAEQEMREAVAAYLAHLHSNKPLGDEFRTLKARIVTLACTLFGTPAWANTCGGTGRER